MLKFYNTLTRAKEEFKPQNPPAVGLYTCGPTVYNYAHIGNLRTYIFEDILKRALVANGFEVNHVMNITDVGHLTSDADVGEDKMEKGAKREGKTVWDIAEFYTKAFKEDMRRLNLVEPDIWCKATDHIAEQIELIQRLEKRGFTYLIDDGVYFDTTKDPHYGKLARLDIAGLRAGARIEMVKDKRNPTDFALWKLSPDNEQRQMEWESPWGKGFPGWHIECSAMAMKYLGETFDIHCGGIDLIPVHHTNEIAQAENATGKKFVHTWLHGEFLLVNEGRMGKSEGNFLTLQTVIDKGFDPLTYRYFTFTAHYRQKLNFSWKALEAARTAFKKLQTFSAELNTNVTNVEANSIRPSIGCAEFEQRFLEAVNDDLNMPQALSLVWELVKSDHKAAEKKATLLSFDRILGLGLADAKQKEIIIPAEVQKLIDARELARGAKDWKTSDDLRAQIAAQGFEIRDADRGPKMNYPTAAELRGIS